MTDLELKDLVAGLAIAQAKTEKIIKELSQNLGGIDNSNGAYAEEFFYNALKKHRKFGGVKYDTIAKNIRFTKKGINDEFDLVLINGNSIGLIETKYKTTSDHLQKLIIKKTESFNILFPEYKDYKFYLGLAAMSFEDEKVEIEAHKAGVAILK